jgi:hypothetical protein
VDETPSLTNKRPLFAAFVAWLRHGNRGLLLDLFVFAVNAFLMGILEQQFYGIILSAKKGDESAIFIVFIYFLSLLVLAPTGAFLKRWHFNEQKTSVAGGDWMEVANGCLFNPIIYFGLIAILSGAVGALLFHFVYGDKGPPAAAQTVLIIVGLALAVVHTAFVYRYFSPAARVPRTRFMRGPISDLVGDICIFLNMLLFQVLWNMLALGFARPKDEYDIFTDLLALVIGSLLIYFPPRIFYLAEDIRRPRTWLLIALANLPVIYRAIFGNSHALRF